MIKKPTIGIIGILGSYGEWLRRFFHELDYKVIGSDVNTTKTNQFVVENADVVIFSVLPIHIVPQVMKTVLPFSREDQLWIDISSLQSANFSVMAQGKAEYIAVHPMCAPANKNWKGEELFVSFGRLKRWSGFVDDFLKNAHGQVHYTTAVAHDKDRILDQALIHILVIVGLMVLTRNRNKVARPGKGKSPLYRLFLMLIGRILHQKPVLFADILMCNPYVKGILLPAIGEQFQTLASIVETNDREKFEQVLLGGKKWFGESELKSTNQRFDELMRKG